jgi:hypothetical protein
MGLDLPPGAGLSLQERAEQAAEATKNTPHPITVQMFVKAYGPRTEHYPGRRWVKDQPRFAHGGASPPADNVMRQVPASRTLLVGRS